MVTLLIFIQSILVYDFVFSSNIDTCRFFYFKEDVYKNKHLKINIIELARGNQALGIPLQKYTN